MKEKILSIQGLRGLGISLIVLSHLDGRFDLGAFGVSLFIAINGYLNCNKQLNENPKYTAIYIIKRLMRFYPLYFLATMITASYFSAALIYNVSKIESIKILILNLLMMHTLFPENVYYCAYTQVGWFVPIIFFSVLSANMMGRIWRKLGRKECLLTLVFIWLGNFIIATLAIKWQHGFWLVYVTPYTRLFECFAAGCVLKLALGSEKESKKDLILDIASILMLVIVVLLMFSKQSFTQTLYYHSFLWLIPSWFIIAGVIRNGFISRLTKLKPLVWIGENSLEIFLFHLIIFHYVECILGEYIKGTLIILLKIISLLIICPVIRRIDKKVKEYSKVLYEKYHIKKC
ncbi:MAG: acyltransferase [Lachnospiraceae bacterium]|nr:acyltransferase [Lachnospiraceae bacterium]